MCGVRRFRSSRIGEELGASGVVGGSVVGRWGKVRYPPLDVAGDSATHGAEQLVHLVQYDGGGIVAEVVEPGAYLGDFILIAWALRIFLPWASGAVPEGAVG